MTATTLKRLMSTEKAILTAADRCGQRGARAYVHVTLTSGGRLFFCAHHGSKHLAPIASKANKILGEHHPLPKD